MVLYVLTESASNKPVKQKTGAAARAGTGRPRGRPKKIVVSEAKQANLSHQERQESGLLLFFSFSVSIVCIHIHVLIHTRLEGTVTLCFYQYIC